MTLVLVAARVVLLNDPLSRSSFWALFHLAVPSASQWKLLSCRCLLERFLNIHEHTCIRLLAQIHARTKSASQSCSSQMVVCMPDTTDCTKSLYCAFIHAVFLHNATWTEPYLQSDRVRVVPLPSASGKLQRVRH